MNRTGVRTIAVIVLGAACAIQAQQAQPTSESQGETLWLLEHGLRLKIKIYRSEKLLAHPRLIVVLHGDSPFGPPSYQYAFARKVAAQIENVVVAAILRPGYSDGSAQKSDGVRGETTGDNYTPAVVDEIAGAVEELKLKFHPAATLLVGHSGGAAICADILGRHPSASNAALLISCPCNLPKWREHMFQLQNKDPSWYAPVESLSPIDLAGKVSPATKVGLLVGNEDPIAPPDLTKEYAEALRQHGVKAEVTIAPGLQHDILLEPVALEELKKLLQWLERPAKE